MRIYAVADIHGSPNRLRRIRQAVARWSPHVVVLAGDVTGWRRRRKTLSHLNGLPVPVLAVGGNSDRFAPGALLTGLANITWMNLGRATVAGRSFVGIGGTVPIPLGNRVGWREGRRLAIAQRWVDRRTVLVTHPPPRGIQDAVLGRWPSGSRGLRALIRRCRPAVCCCGHIHEQPGFGWLAGTLVVNCSMGQSGLGALVTLQPDRPPRVQMLPAKG